MREGMRERISTRYPNPHPFNLPPPPPAPPNLSRPSRRASARICCAMRSLTDPPGLRNSALARISHPVASDRDLMRIRGVLPIHPATPSTISSRTTDFVALFLFFLFVSLIGPWFLLLVLVLVLVLVTGAGGGGRERNG